jgi:hypothetical protein
MSARCPRFLACFESDAPFLAPFIFPIPQNYPRIGSAFPLYAQEDEMCNKLDKNPLLHSVQQSEPPLTDGATAANDDPLLTRYFLDDRSLLEELPRFGLPARR